MKILYVTTIGNTMGFFNCFIGKLIEAGHIVDIATNENDGKTPVQDIFRKYGCNIRHISCSRSPLDRGNITAVSELKKIIKNGNYDIVHCHTPIAAVCTRLACKKERKKGTSLFYTAHGFHFYHSAPLKNWILYYPIEWLCSWWTDVLITINQEDYNRAKKRLHAKKTVYIPGVGIDIDQFKKGTIDIEKKRAELGLQDEDIMLLSVGELSARKNHEIVIRALHELENPHVKYFICGEGELEQYLGDLIWKLGMKNKVKLLGYRTDISELCQSADLFIFPSRQEGLPVALMEAIACKTPVICSKIRGNTDLVRDYLFNGNDVQALTKIFEGVVTTRESIHAVMGDSVKKNYERLKIFDLRNVSEEMRKLYRMTL